MADPEGAWEERLDRLIDGVDPAAKAPDDLRVLAALAAELRRTLAPAAASPAARDRVLARLLRRTRAQTSAARRTAPVRRPMILRPAFALAGVALALLLTTGTGVAYAAESSLPGDTLYPVKRGLEQAQLALSATPAGDAGLAATFADRRLAEFEALTTRGRWSDAEHALQAYATAVDDLVRLDALAGDPNRSADIDSRLSYHLEVLEGLESIVPESAQPALLKALEHAGRGRQEVENRRNEAKPEHTPPGQDKKKTESPGAPGG